MQTRNTSNVAEVRAAVTQCAGDGGAAADAYTARKLTFAQNAMLTIKVLAIFGLLGAALWGISIWTSAK